MNYWQFKFDMKNGTWKEFATIEVGEEFDQSIQNHKQMANSIGDIIFFYRIDSNRGIHFITEIISTPYQAEYNTGYAIDLRVIKRIENPYNNLANNNFGGLEKKINAMGKGGGKYKLKEEDNGQKLYDVLMKDTLKLSTKDQLIDKDDLEIIKKIKSEYIDNGYIFNPFTQMNLIRSEVRHLSFIGNLINPLGNHFQGNLFLKAFIESLLLKDKLEENEHIEKFCTNNPIVEIEKSISDEDGKSIGRIDLWLENDNFIIAIEGKIESKDNKGQLLKYNKFLEQNKKEYILIYLTLYGEKPEKVDKDELINFYLMDFETDIINFISFAQLDENILEGVNNELFNYKDALNTYLYKYHLSTQFSLKIIDEITSNKDNFDKYQMIKEIYYKNRSKYQLTVVEDIAMVFEYAKADIERKFFEHLKRVINDSIDEVCFLGVQYIFSLNIENDEDSDDIDNEITTLSSIEGIERDIYTLYKARKRRFKPIITEDNYDFGDIKCHISIKNNIYEITSNSFGIIVKNMENNFKESDIKSSKDIFLSKNISKLLDKQYLDKQIYMILSDIIN
jgi:hypothetical protein